VLRWEGRFKEDFGRFCRRGYSLERVEVDWLIDYFLEAMSY
jgi:hypothetical protein